MTFTTMTGATDANAGLDWHQANQRYLMAALACVRAALESHIAGEAGDPYAHAGVRQETLRTLCDRMPAPPALDTLGATFNLSPFERDVVLLSAGAELDSTFAALCAAAQDDPQRAYPTFSLALAVLPAAHWSALTPTAPLRRWRLIEIGAGGTLMTSPLRIDERVLHYLTGLQHLDEHLIGFVQPEPAVSDLVPSHREIAEGIARTWAQAHRPGRLPVVQLCGVEMAGKRAIAAMACEMLGLNLYSMPAQVIPSTPHELDSLMRLWEREAALSLSALLLDCEDLDRHDTARESVVTRFIEEVSGAVFVTGRERRMVQRRPIVTFDIRKPRADEQRVLWHETLGAAVPVLNGQVERLVAQFDLSAPVIRSACARALGDWPAHAPTQPAALARMGARLWEACRTQARPRLDDLAQRIEPVATWEDLVLPESQLQTLHEIAAHVRQRAKVYEEWGFAAKSARGLGISALFAGPSGTGKTMAAEVLANELQLDLYHIDLSQVVSKYIGETEKNLRRVFDAAEEGGAILLFDEADALFGKRSEVKDSHDRYANIEVSYLLQRMEAYRGLAILTTNMKKALDSAFLRRIRFVVQFPFPDAAARTEIWRRIFPPDTPTEGLDVQKLARLNVAGGNIRNIALNAAFLAADAGEPVRMAHLLQAARTEYSKLEKSLTDAEVEEWV
jgi:ATP-dependent 26S proteasome regulatory subunit